MTIFSGVEILELFLVKFQFVDILSH